MSDDDAPQDDLGPNSMGAGTRPGSTGARVRMSSEPSLSEPSPAPALQPEEAGTVVLAGPPGVGKTLWLCGVEQACSSNTLESTWLKLSYGPEMADLITIGYERDRARESLDATAGVRSYTFSISATTAEGRNGFGRKRGRLLGVKTCNCLDGPGGALFFDDLTERSTLDETKEKYRRSLLAAGRVASCLVFFVNPVHRFEQANISGNMTLLLGELGVPIDMPIDPEEDAPSGFWNWFSSRLNRSAPSPEPQPAATRRTEPMRKLNASQVMFVFNHIDQVCVYWQQEWQKNGDPRGQLTPLEIAQQHVNPLELAQHVLGPRFLQTVHGFLRDDATLAVAVCSAGGFMTNGDPFRGADGRVNVLDSIDPRAAEEHRQVFGIRETLMFAGFGITTPGIVEKISWEQLALPSERNRTRSRG